MVALYHCCSCLWSLVMALYHCCSGFWSSMVAFYHCCSGCITVSIIHFQLNLSIVPLNSNDQSSSPVICHDGNVGVLLISNQIWWWWQILSMISHHLWVMISRWFSPGLWYYDKSTTNQTITLYRFRAKDAVFLRLGRICNYELYIGYPKPTNTIYP